MVSRSELETAELVAGNAVVTVFEMSDGNELTIDVDALVVVVLGWSGAAGGGEAALAGSFVCTDGVKDEVTEGEPGRDALCDAGSIVVTCVLSAD